MDDPSKYIRGLVGAFMKTTDMVLSSSAIFYGNMLDLELSSSSIEYYM